MDDAFPGFFHPTGTFWRVNRENVLMLGGGYALLLQLAHPLVAAGVNEHSGFRDHPLRYIQLAVYRIKSPENLFFFRDWVPPCSLTPSGSGSSSSSTTPAHPV